jgi:hypothetical protein
MREKIRLSVLVVTVVLTLVGFRCWYGGGKEPPPDQQGPVGTTAAAKKNNVNIVFRGLVVHVFGKGIGKRDQSVVLKHAQHPVRLNFPDSIDQTALASVTGKPVTFAGPGRVEVEDIMGVAVRIVGWDAVNKKVVSTINLPLDTSNKFFNDRAPHLEKISDGTLTKNILKSTLFDDLPDNSDWAVFVPIDGGTFTAHKACKSSKFKKDYEKKKTRDFAAEVVLSGDVDLEPAIQFMKTKGVWETPPVTFTRSPFGDTMRVIAEARSALTMSHFPEFERLGNPKPAKFDDIAFKDCGSKGPDPACTNSQWP